jgi:hypothetical protein
MTKIVLKLNCKKKYCGSCDHVEYFRNDRRCSIFGRMLESDKDGYLRCSLCLEADGEMARLEEADEDNKRWNEGTDCNTCPLNTWEACNEICESRATLIEKIAELDAEIKEKE